jgi:hypothetical protein
MTLCIQVEAAYYILPDKLQRGFAARPYFIGMHAIYIYI